MKVILILALMTVGQAFALECKKVGYEFNNKMRQELMLAGKGTFEIDEIMDARWSACYGKCGQLDRNVENCMPMAFSKKKKGK